MTDEPAAPPLRDEPAAAPLDGAAYRARPGDTADDPTLDEAAERRRADAARDQRLVERTLAGDLDAFNELVAHYQDLLFGLTYRVVRDRDAAADAVQEAFFSAYQEPRSLPGHDLPSVALADRHQRRDRRPAPAQASAGRSLSGVGGRRLAAADRPSRRPGAAGDPPGAGSRHQPGDGVDHSRPASRDPALRRRGLRLPGDRRRSPRSPSGPSSPGSTVDASRCATCSPTRWNSSAMGDVSEPMTNASPIHVPDDHAGHDRQLVVAFACGDLPTEDVADARALIARCRRCATLVDEIMLISAATKDALVAPPRSRDFRLTRDDAERLRGSALSRLPAPPRRPSTPGPPATGRCRDGHRHRAPGHDGGRCRASPAPPVPRPRP